MLTAEQKEAVRELLKNELSLRVEHCSAGDYYSNDQIVLTLVIYWMHPHPVH